MLLTHGSLRLEASALNSRALQHSGRPSSVALGGCRHKWGVNSRRAGKAFARRQHAVTVATGLTPFTGDDGKDQASVFKSQWLDKAKQQESAVETVQLIEVVFKLKLQTEFGESVRLIGGHELLGAWNLEHAVQLNWSPGDVWTSKPVELPVDGVFVYKYYRANTTGQPVAWQQGNNQILTLSRADAPMLEVQDNWRGDPAAALTCAPDGSRRMQAEVRLVTRVRDADRALIEAQQEIAHLTEELRHARLQTKALREEARLGANVRLALKDQLRAEKKRSTILEQQVDAWRAKALAAKEQAAGSGATAIPGAGAAGMKGDQKQVEAGKPQQAKAEGAAPGAKAEAQPAGNKASNGAAGAPKQAATTSKAESA